MSRGIIRPTKEKHHVLFARKTIIIGTDNESIKIAKNIQKRFDTGLDIIGFVDRKLTIETKDLFLPFLFACGCWRGVMENIVHLLRMQR